MLLHKRFSEMILSFFWIPDFAGMTTFAACHSSESWNPVLYNMPNKNFKNIIESCLNSHQYYSHV